MGYVRELRYNSSSILKVQKYMSKELTQIWVYVLFVLRHSEFSSTHKNSTKLTSIVVDTISFLWESTTAQEKTFQEV